MQRILARSVFVRRFCAAPERDAFARVKLVGTGDLKGCVTIQTHKAAVGDVVEFSEPGSSTKTHGQVVNVWADNAWVRLPKDASSMDLSEAELLIGAKDDASRKAFSIPVGDRVLGRVLDVDLQPVDGLGSLADGPMKNLGTWQPEIADRGRISRPMVTGIKVLDALVPFGRGQSLVLCGDRGTGKTTTSLDILASHLEKDKTKCVYVAIGKSAEDVEQVVKQLEASDSKDHTVVLCTPPDASLMDTFALPLVAVTIAEAFRDAGHDALIVYDDLNAHIPVYTRFCKELDESSQFLDNHILWRIFYSNLVQRSACLNKKLGGGTLSTLLVLETPELGPYEMMSVSDGQIWLSSELLRSRLPPADLTEDQTAAELDPLDPRLVWPCVDIRKSLSRVGSKAMHPALAELCAPLRQDLMQWMDESKGFNARRAARFQEAFQQPAFRPVPILEQLVLLYALGTSRLSHIIDVVPADQVQAFGSGLLAHMACGAHANTLQLINSHLSAAEPLSAEAMVGLRLAVAEYSFLFTEGLKKAEKVE